MTGVHVYLKLQQLGPIPYFTLSVVYICCHIGVDLQTPTYTQKRGGKCPSTDFGRLL